ncbi:MAG TPA: hypothetical protein VJM15_09390 [Sphingomicrobium sp.]|nr:hypothetical protein [Sphingomicrobium sp.]
MADLSISKAWDETTAVLARDGKLITNVALALIVLPQALAGVLAPPPTLSGASPPAWMPVVSVIVAIVGIIGQIAIARLALGPSITVGQAIEHGGRRVIPAFVALILFGVALALILTPIFLLIAGMSGLESLSSERPTPAAAGAIFVILVLCLFAAPRFQLVVPTAAGEDGGPIRLLRRSWELTAGSYWRLFGFLLLVLIAAFVVVLFVGQIMVGIIIRTTFGTIHPFTLGALVAALLTAAAAAAFAAVTSVVVARIYAQLSGRGAASVPKSGT